MRNAPRVIISGVHGKSGKTIFTTLLIHDLVSRGIRVRPFKVGPDFIDPMHHAAACGCPSRNLDEYLMGMDGVKCRLMRYSDGDVSIIEGVLGLYDSVDGVTETGSTAKIARETGTPVILVMDGDRTNRSLAAVLRGFRGFDDGVNIAGVAVTNVTKRQIDKLTRLFKGEGVPIVGVIPRSEEIERDFRYRHLGLVPVVEGGGGGGYDHWIDVDAVLRIAGEASPLEHNCGGNEGPPKTGLRVGIIMDKAFSFYYPETLETINSAAGEVIIIDSMRDGALPNIDALIIGGGFPEEHADLIERNRSLLADIRRFSERGGFIYAECGGLMLLSSTLETINNEEYGMSGVIDAYVTMLRRPVGHGYVESVAIMDTPMFRMGENVKGHEFHHSRLILREKADFYLRIIRGSGINGYDGIRKRNTFAQYTHMHPEGLNAVGNALSNIWRERNKFPSGPSTA
ncbi:MAG: cobyrinate a,c-diamide synthase [Thermocladium sp.]